MVIYAYKTNEKGEIVGAYQGPNPPLEFDHRYDQPIPDNAKIVNGEIVIPEPVVEPTPAQPTADELRQQKFAQINANYQSQLRQLRETMALLAAQNLATDKVKIKYAAVVSEYKQALLDALK